MPQHISGVVYDVNSRPMTVKTAKARLTGAGNNAFIAAVAGHKIRVLAYRFQASAAVNVKFTDTDGSDLSQLWEFEAREGCAIEAPEGSFEFETAVGKGVQVNLSGAVAVNVSAQYVEVPV